MKFLAYPAMEHPEVMRSKYPVEVSDYTHSLSEATSGPMYLSTGIERYAQRERRSIARSREEVIDVYDQEFDYEEYRELILNRSREEAPRQLKVSQDISSHALFGPAAIQAPTPLAMLENNVETPTKQNSTVVTGFDYIKALLGMSAAQGQYFDNLSEVRILLKRKQISPR